MAADLGSETVSFVQYRLNRLRNLYVTPCREGSIRYLTEKGQAVVDSYVPPEKRHDWRIVAQRGD